MSLGELKDSRAYEPLIKHLKFWHRGVIRALGDLGDKRAIPHLKGLIGDVSHRGCCDYLYDALIKLGETDYVATLKAEDKEEALKREKEKVEALYETSKEPEPGGAEEWWGDADAWGSRIS